MIIHPQKKTSNGIIIKKRWCLAATAQVAMVEMVADKPCMFHSLKTGKYIERTLGPEAPNKWMTME